MMPNIPDKLQIRLTSSVESILASLEPYAKWMEQMLDAPLSETLTLEVDCNPGEQEPFQDSMARIAIGFWDNANVRATALY